MEEKQDQKSKLIEMAIKVALSLAITFIPVYVVLYITYPYCILAIYLICAGFFAVFAPWDDLKKKFLS